jgi:hypothetical protein
MPLRNYNGCVLIILSLPVLPMHTDEAAKYPFYVGSQVH